jgi:UDP-N-acetylmuramate dehydrogenase
MSDLETLAVRLGPGAQPEAPLGARTTYRVGGTAAVLYAARTVDDLAVAADALRGLDVDVLVVGKGSNLLVSDAGFRGLAVTLAGDFESIGEAVVGSESSMLVSAGGAAALPVLARRLAETGMSGLEWGVGVPGSVGGAVRMNAGGHGSDISESLVSAELFSLATGERVVRSARELGLSYRHSDIRSDEIVTSATFRLTEGPPDASRAAIAEIVRWRRANQPGGSNAGSVFTNPPGDAAGRLVEAAGAKGLRHGTAHVSVKHANFIQADEAGSADDVHALIEEVRALVLHETGVELATELVTVGFGDTP